MCMHTYVQPPPPHTHANTLQPRPPTAEISPGAADDDSKAVKEAAAAEAEAENEGETGAHAEPSTSGTENEKQVVEDAARKSLVKRVECGRPF